MSFSTPAVVEEAPLSSAEESDLLKEGGYTINYNTVAITEYIRFASRICNTNFLFNEADLNFTVTVVSDAPITPENVMATLLQVLRINSFELLEQDNNLVIHKSADVRQIATLVTENGQARNAPIVTRIFRIGYSKPESIAGIIRPMISGNAILEVSAETRQLILTDIRANVDKVADLIEILDSPHNPLEMKTYEPKHNTPESLVELCSQIMAPLAQSHPFTLVAQPLSNSIFIVSTPDLVSQTLTALTSLDSPPKKNLLIQRKLKADNIFIYKAENRSSEHVIGSLNDIAQGLQKTGIPELDLIETIETARLIQATNSILFVGTKDALTKIKEFLESIDTPVKEGVVLKQAFFIYKLQNGCLTDIERALKEVAENLKDSKGADQFLIDLLQSVKSNFGTNTLIFSGEERFFPQVKELLATIDNPAKKGTCILKNEFFVYKIQHAPYADLSTSLQGFAKHLNKSNVGDEGLIRSIEEMKYVPETNSILFSGPEPSLQRLQELLPSFDAGIASTTMAAADTPAPEQSFFLYTLRSVSKEKADAYLNQLVSNLDKRNESSLINAIRSMKWIDASHSYMFQGDAEAISRLKEMLQTFDVPDVRTVKTGYYVYKLRAATGEAIEEDLHSLSKTFKTSGMKGSDVLYVIDNIRYVKETNSLLLTGDPAAIEEVKTLIAEYDNPSPTRISSDFYMYKPQHKPASEIEKSLKEVATNLKKAGLADTALLSAIESAKYISTTNSLIFTGTADAILKVQSLLKDIDVPPSAHAPIQHVGKTTFLLYKLKNAGGPQIVNSIKMMETNLKKSSSADKAFLSALDSMKYIKETNSLFFTGTEETLTRVQTLVEQLDVASLAPHTPTITKSEPTPPPTTSSDFFIYKPHSLPGPDLEKLMEDFSENLKLSGLSDPDLFNAIVSMRWVDKTQSLIFTGTPKALAQVKDLLTTFDVPANLPKGSQSSPIASTEPSIQAIDNTSFLVYKLQFHKGDEIQGALKQIAKDLTKNNAPVNQSLLNSIDSIQWLDVTNSLLCSGDQDTLSRLKELIKNLDVPLKQVFIEILIIETSLTNALNFGLEWGTNYKFNDKFGVSSYNTIPQANAQSPFPDTFITNLSNLMPPTAPTPIGNIPPSSGFDLGVIGEVIKHNGQTFLTLGSLLSALQSDTETTIVNTPKILAQDGRTSSFFSGANVPFTGSFVNNTQSGATVQTSNLEYRDIGLNLTLTPVLGNSDIVTLEISLDREQTATDITQSQLNFNAQTANGIVTSKTTMQTTVHVPDRNFLILSGFVNNSNTKQKAGIPCLGGLPMIGAAFSQSNDTISNQNIVVFLRPYILNSIDDMRRVTSEQEDFFRDQAATPFLEHYFDESIELIKTIDDE